MNASSTLLPGTEVFGLDRQDCRRPHMAGGSREGHLPRALVPQPGDHISAPDLLPGLPCDLGLQSHKNFGDGVGPGWWCSPLLSRRVGDQIAGGLLSRAEGSPKPRGPARRRGRWRSCVGQGKSSMWLPAPRKGWNTVRGWGWNQRDRSRLPPPPPPVHQGPGNRVRPWWCVPAS